MTGLHSTSPNVAPETRSETLSAVGAIDRAALMALLRSMTLRERLIVCLRYADGLSLDEISVVLQAGKSEVERLLEQAVERVRAAIALPAPA